MAAEEGGRESLGTNGRVKPSRNIRVCPGIRGSLPRMSVDGENYDRFPM
jgi:hypothetical protein